MADRIHYGGEWKWAKKVTDLLNEGGGGNVDDVKVNGTSVVDANKVAQIDLTPYVESTDLATVATSGSYNDLTDKPTIPAAQDRRPCPRYGLQHHDRRPSGNRTDRRRHSWPGR